MQFFIWFGIHHNIRKTDFGIRAVFQIRVGFYICAVDCRCADCVQRKRSFRGAVSRQFVDCAVFKRNAVAAPVALAAAADDNLAQYGYVRKAQKAGANAFCDVQITGDNCVIQHNIRTGNRYISAQRAKGIVPRRGQHCTERIGKHDCRLRAGNIALGAERAVAVSAHVSLVNRSPDRWPCPAADVSAVCKLVKQKLFRVYFQVAAKQGSCFLAVDCLSCTCRCFGYARKIPLFICHADIIRIPFFPRHILKGKVSAGMVGIIKRPVQHRDELSTGHRAVCMYLPVHIASDYAKLRHLIHSVACPRRRIACRQRSGPPHAYAERTEPDSKGKAHRRQSFPQ